MHSERLTCTEELVSDWLILAHIKNWKLIKQVN